VCITKKYSTEGCEHPEGAPHIAGKKQTCIKYEDETTGGVPNKKEAGKKKRALSGNTTSRDGEE